MLNTLCGWPNTYRYHHSNLKIFTALTKKKSREPAYSQALNQTKFDRQRSTSRESGRQAGRQSDSYGGWCFQFRMKELWRDNNRWSFGKFVRWIRYLSQHWREFVPKRRNSYGYGTIGKSQWWGNRRVEQYYGGRGTGWMWWLDREQLTEIGGLRGLKRAIGEWYCLVFYSFRYFEPAECLENRSDLVMFTGFSNSMGDSTLNGLEVVYFVS